MVPRLLIRSSLSIPMPLSLMLKVFLSLSILISILGSNFKLLYLSSLTLKKLSLSKASLAFEISSLKKISLLEYKECIISCKS